MSENIINKIELGENAFEQLNKEMPKEIIDKLSAIKNQVYHRYDEFKTILQGLLGSDYDNYKDIVLNFVEQLDSDEDTLEQDLYSDNNGKGSIYPYDPSKADIDIREDPQTVYELVDRKYDRGLIEMPDFQRKFVWKLEQQSLFIESILLNFPLPPLYINKDSRGKYLVVDGRQRITTLRRFLKNEFRLSGLKAFPKLNDKNFDDLRKINSEYQSKIEDKKLLVYLIQPTVPLEMVYDIFNRINTGGTQLERQEIRNCIYLGLSTKFLQRLASKEIFKKAIDYGISDNRAKDQEAILRFISFRLFDYKLDYKNSMNEFVENSMKRINSLLSINELQNLDNNFEKILVLSKELKNLEDEFDKTMKLTFDFFGKRNFRIPTEETRGRINIAVLETVGGFFAAKGEDFLKENKAQIKANFTLLLKDEAYLDAVQFSTGDRRRVYTRFDRVFDILSKECVNS